MTELAVREDTNPTPVRALPAAASMSRIAQVVADMEDAHRLAVALVQTSFVPQAFRGKPDDATAAILYGDTIDMDPLTSLQQIHVISGKPGLYARAMVGLVMSHGHRVWTEVDTPERVVVCGQRKGESTVERSDWTAARARLAGYYSNKKYETDPQAMLYARASGDVARRIAPDVLLGMAYNVEELQADPLLGQSDDITDTTTVERAETPRGGVSRLALAVADEPRAEPVRETPAAVIDAQLPPDDAPPPEPGGEPDPTPAAGFDEPKMTRGQNAQMHAQFNALGIKDRDQRLTITSKMLGRDIESSTELTMVDGTAVLNTLEQFAGDRQRLLDAFEIGGDQ